MASHPISPAGPTKRYPPPIQPNPHPYAIKTTSSALLSRSSASLHSPHHTRHNYIPSPPSRAQAETTEQHRHSSSLSSVEGEVHGINEVSTVPAPLPTPPLVVSTSPDDQNMSLKRTDPLKIKHRVRRAETMPSSAIAPIATNCSYELKHEFSRDEYSRSELYAGLPSNPKQWNTDELITYLETCFKSENGANGDEEDSGLVNIIECVRTRRFTGRELLRLTDADLAGTPLSDVQCTQLLEHSRTLRAEVLRGRICVDSHHSREVSNNSNDIYSQSSHSFTPFHNVCRASASTEDLHLLLDNTGKGECAFPLSPVVSLHRSNSVSEASAQRYRDLAHMRMRRRGRVKGLVETWERASTSGSECSTSEDGSVSGSEAESESEIDLASESITRTRRSPELSPDLSSALRDESHHEVRSSAVDSVVVPREPPLLTPPPPYTHTFTTGGVIADREEEPSIEELLVSSPSLPLRGARAWEADFGLGDTVKRIPIPMSSDAGDHSSLVMEPDISRYPQDDRQQTNSIRLKGSGMRRSTGRRGKDAKTRNRVITAIFTGSLSDDAPGDARARHRHTNDTDGVREVPVSSEPQDDPDSALQALEESIAATRIQLEALRLRLEEVEADTARQEGILMRAPFSDPRYSPGFDSRQQQSEANERVTPETAETARNETVARRRAMLETVPLSDLARAIVARAIGWLFPYRHLGMHVPNGHDKPQAGTGSRFETSDRYRSPAKRNVRLPLAHISCNIILVSFAICAVVLRRMGFGRWIRRP